MRKVHPITIIITGLFFVSLLFNSLQSLDNSRLRYRIQKLEAGPWKSLFEGEPLFPKHKPDQDNIKPRHKNIDDLVT